MAAKDFPALLRIADGRDHLTTGEFGKVINRTGQTIRKNLCVDGHAYGIYPKKIMGRLAWPVSEILQLLENG